MELFIVEFLVLKITSLNVISEKGETMIAIYVSRFFFWFHALVDVYPADFLGWEPVPETHSMFSLLLTISYVLPRCLASSPRSLRHRFSACDDSNQSINQSINQEF